MTASSLQDLYVQKLHLLQDAEQQILQALPEMIQQSRSADLREALENHRRETEEQSQRLRTLTQRRGGAAAQSECKSMRALIQEAQQMLPTLQDPDVKDAFIIGAAQAVEHHEIAAYGTARTWADQLGFDDDVDTLQETLDEEGKADKLLSHIAEHSVNEQATQGTDREVHLGGGGQADRAQRPAGSRAASSSSSSTNQEADRR